MKKTIFRRRAASALAMNFNNKNDFSFIVQVSDFIGDRARPVCLPGIKILHSCQEPPAWVMAFLDRMSPTSITCQVGVQPYFSGIALSQRSELT